MARSSSHSSAVDAILAEAADLVALEHIAALNTAHLISSHSSSSLPPSLESRFRKLKSLPTPTPSSTLQTPPPPNSTKIRSASSLGRIQTTPPSTNQETIPQQEAASQKPPTPRIQYEDEEEEFGSGGFPTSPPSLRERGSPSPPRPACCFGFSPKKALLQRMPSKGSNNGSKGEEEKGISGIGEWGEESSRRMVAELKAQKRKLKKALREQEKVSREAAKMGMWVKQASARMTHTAAIDDLLGDDDDDDELK